MDYPPTTNCWIRHCSQRRIQRGSGTDRSPKRVLQKVGRFQIFRQLALVYNHTLSLLQFRLTELVQDSVMKMAFWIALLHKVAWQQAYNKHLGLSNFFKMQYAKIGRFLTGLKKAGRFIETQRILSFAGYLTSIYVCIEGRLGLYVSGFA